MAHIQRSTIVREIASAIVAMRNARESGNDTWTDRHADNAERLVREFLPSGSGIDCGTTLDLDASRPDRIVLSASYHHMDESGGYDGWTDHNVVVTPSLAFGHNVRVTGRNRNYIKSYLAEVYDYALGRTIVRDVDADRDAGKFQWALADD